jgi:hypothetical protein
VGPAKLPPAVAGVIARPTEIRLPVLGSCLRMNLVKTLRLSRLEVVPPSCLNRAGIRVSDVSVSIGRRIPIDAFPSSKVFSRPMM